MRSKRNKSRTQSKPKGESHLQGAAAADAGGYVAETDSFPDNPPPHEASSAMAGGIAAASAGSAGGAAQCAFVDIPRPHQPQADGMDSDWIPSQARRVARPCAAAAFHSRPE